MQVWRGTSGIPLFQHAGKSLVTQALLIISCCDSSSLEQDSELASGTVMPSGSINTGISPSSSFAPHISPQCGGGAQCCLQHTLLHFILTPPSNVHSELWSLVSKYFML